MSKSWIEDQVLSAIEKQKTDLLNQGVTYWSSLALVIRKVLFLSVICFAGVIFFISVIFATVNHIVYLFQNSMEFRFDILLALGLSIISLMTITTMILFSKNLWLKIFGINLKAKTLFGLSYNDQKNHNLKSQSAYSQISKDEIKKIVKEAIHECLNEDLTSDSGPEINA